MIYTVHMKSRNTLTPAQAQEMLAAKPSTTQTIETLLEECRNKGLSPLLNGQSLHASTDDEPEEIRSPAMQQLVYELLGELLSNMGIYIPPEEYPDVQLFEPGDFGKNEQWQSVYARQGNIVYLCTSLLAETPQSPLSLSDAIGHALGTFIQTHRERNAELGWPSHPDHREYDAEAMQVKSAACALVGRKVMAEVVHTLGLSSSFTTKIEAPVIKEGATLLERVESEKRQTGPVSLHEKKGREIGNRIDPKQIHEWEKFFSLSPQELEKRFRVDPPDYSKL